MLVWSVAAALAVALALLSLTRNGWVPFLSGVDLGVHEFGHLLAFWAPPLVMSLAGSALQVAAPAALASYFWWRRDRFAVVLLVAWLGMSLNNVSVYIGDAQRMVLPLFGDDGSGAGHDWRNILGQLGWLERTDMIAGGVRMLAVVTFFAALGLAGWFAVTDLRPDREGAVREGLVRDGSVREGLVREAAASEGLDREALVPEGSGCEEPLSEGPARGNRHRRVGRPWGSPRASSGWSHLPVRQR